MSARIWLKADGDAALLGVEQRQPEQDQQAGDAGGQVHLFGLRRPGGDAVAAHQRLIEAEIEAEQVLAEDGEAEHDQGEPDQPRQRADGPEGEAEQADGPGDDAAGGGRRHAARPGKPESAAESCSCHAKQDHARRSRQRRTPPGARSAATYAPRVARAAPFSLDFSHSPSSPKFTEMEPEALGAPRQKAATTANERVLPPCERVIA